MISICNYSGYNNYTANIMHIIRRSFMNTILPPRISRGGEGAGWPEANDRCISFVGTKI